MAFRFTRSFAGEEGGEGAGGQDGSQAGSPSAGGAPASGQAQAGALSTAGGAAAAAVAAAVEKVQSIKSFKDIRLDIGEGRACVCGNILAPQGGRTRYPALTRATLQPLVVQLPTSVPAVPLNHPARTTHPLTHPTQTLYTCPSRRHGPDDGRGVPGGGAVLHDQHPHRRHLPGEAVAAGTRGEGRGSLKQRLVCQGSSSPAVWECSPRHSSSGTVEAVLTCTYAPVPPAPPAVLWRSSSSGCWMRALGPGRWKALPSTPLCRRPRMERMMRRAMRRMRRRVCQVGALYGTGSSRREELGHSSAAWLGELRTQRCRLLVCWLARD